MRSSEVCFTNHGPMATRTSLTRFRRFLLCWRKILTPFNHLTHTQSRKTQTQARGLTHHVSSWLCTPQFHRRLQSGVWVLCVCCWREDVPHTPLASPPAHKGNEREEISLTLCFCCSFFPLPSLLDFSQPHHMTVINIHHCGKAKNSLEDSPLSLSLCVWTRRS